MLLTADEHCIGRLVEDTRFQIESIAVSAYHCKIYRRRLGADDSEYTVFLKDTRFCIVRLALFPFSFSRSYFIFYCMSDCIKCFAVRMEHISTGTS